MKVAHTECFKPNCDKVVELLVSNNHTKRHTKERICGKNKDDLFQRVYDYRSQFYHDPDINIGFADDEMRKKYFAWIEQKRKQSRKKLSIKESNGSLYNSPSTADRLYYSSLNVYKITFADGVVKYTRAKNKFNAEMQASRYDENDNEIDIESVELLESFRRKGARNHLSGK